MVLCNAIAFLFVIMRRKATNLALLTVSCLLQSIIHITDGVLIPEAAAQTGRKLLMSIWAAHSLSFREGARLLIMLGSETSREEDEEQILQ